MFRPALVVFRLQLFVVVDIIRALIIYHRMRAVCAY